LLEECRPDGQYLFLQKLSLQDLQEDLMMPMGSKGLWCHQQLSPFGSMLRDPMKTTKLSFGVVK
jgi:hypothetical protein